LFGLMRVRSMQMNDAHMYCTEDQFEQEFIGVTQMYLRYFKLFGIDKYVMRLSLHDPKELGKKYIDEPVLWKHTEEMVRRAMKKAKVNTVEVPNEAAFYGPKIDIEVFSSIGREFTLATNQVDFAVPKRMNLVYTDEKGQEKHPLVIHRAPLGTHERFIGFLIEHFGGAFPTWLAPVQVAILPVAEVHEKYAEEVRKMLFEQNIRVELYKATDSLGKRIRHAEMQKIPHVLVLGDTEKKAKSVTVRDRKTKEQKTLKLASFVKKVVEEVTERTLN